ncbi:hypothetical protein [Actinocrinis sp.]|uniref:hypothetical protein n=1 Tax=Actinocrinis sp. TaxID=1920516 RepID=UPI002D75C8B1|nr:hypothetical protein [Actinocrinis sp.]HZP54099.1 hypothetical protein [Actinocrinis sp.]
MSNTTHTRHTTRHVAESVALATVGYPALLRKRCLTWGATHEERVREMPGDDLLPSAAVVTTRAVTIHAPASAVWPWLVQMGPGRGGAYSYDWIENLLGLGIHSADEVLPEFQHPQIGDAQRLGRKGPVLRLAVLEPERALVFRSDDGAWVWSFGLYPQGESTRLVSRNRITRPHRTPATAAFDLYVMEPGSLVMERKMLHGIKQRAEMLAREPAAGPAS